MTALVNWLLGRNQRRTDPLPAHFPAAWNEILQRDVPFFRRLPTDDSRTQLQRDIYWFITLKTWTPFDLVIDDRKKVIIAANACLLLNGRLDLGVFPRTREIIVRTGSFGEHIEAIAPDGSRHLMRDDRIGEAWYRGPVILSWNAVEPLTRQLYPQHNVVIHEFAHALDYLDGWADGTPPLETQREIAAWAEIFTREFEHLRRPSPDTSPSGIDSYGATNAAEFFAVVTEHFFCQPRELQHRHAELFDQLRQFFNQDPTLWSPANPL